METKYHLVTLDELPICTLPDSWQVANYVPACSHEDLLGARCAMNALHRYGETDIKIKAGKCPGYNDGEY